ncbi:hypothetical protein SCHPADRAFT_572721 [Schizopora paradoxa]|uniref:Uncharacterized protein n=1 Tax=Schizopora paradoxa TaxID=27342 RepID=A0A0H2RCS3_9AGAM|nr:hypothetical protein SCHPADRAFT_572721 [Schizopora paradoxa]
MMDTNIVEIALASTDGERALLSSIYLCRSPVDVRDISLVCLSPLLNRASLSEGYRTRLDEFISLSFVFFSPFILFLLVSVLAYTAPLHFIVRHFAVPPFQTFPILERTTSPAPLTCLVVCSIPDASLSFLLLWSCDQSHRATRS